jgi:hypothetical protein
MQRVPVAKTLLIAGVCALIPLAGNVAASFVTEWTGAGSWLVVPAVGVLVAMVTALIQAFGSASAPASAPDRDRWPGERDDSSYGGPTYRQYGRPRRGGTPLPLAVAIAIVVLGGGGWALAQGVRYGVGYITGNEPGTEQLLGRATGRSDGLTLTVESVKRTAHFTRVQVRARNATPNFSMTLPLFKNCTFRGLDGTTLEANSFKSRWTEELSPGALQQGTITFDGHVPESIRVAELSFAHVLSFPVGGATFEQGPGSITVQRIHLRPT